MTLSFLIFTQTLMQAPSSPPGPFVLVEVDEARRETPRAVVTRHEVILPSPAALGIRACATPASQSGIGQVALTLEPTGTVSHVEVTGPFTARETACIAKLYAPIHSNAFNGVAMVVRAFVSLVREAPPAWAKP